MPPASYFLHLMARCQEILLSEEGGCAMDDAEADGLHWAAQWLGDHPSARRKLLEASELYFEGFPGRRHAGAGPDHLFSRDEARNFKNNLMSFLARPRP